jgi:hypothetical protein
MAIFDKDPTSFLTTSQWSRGECQIVPGKRLPYNSPIYNGMGILKELVLLQEPKGEAVLPHHQFCGGDQHLERLTRWRGKDGFCHGPPRPWCSANAPKAHQHEHTATQEPSHRHPFLVRQHTPDGSLIVLALGLDLHESEHPVKKMPTDGANH